MERLEPSARDAMLDALLADQTPTRVVAISETGFFVLMPSAVPLTGQAVIDPPATRTTALDLVVEADHSKIIEAWATARQTGSGSCSVHPLADPGVEVAMCYLDMTHRFGVFLGFVVGEHQVEGGERSGPGLMRARVASMRKDEVAMIISCDEAVTEILGWQSSELVGRRSLELVHPDDHVRAVANYLDMIGKPGQARRARLRHQHRDGHWIWFEVTNTNLLNHPDHGYVHAEMIDISEEMAAAEALRASELLLRRLADALPQGVLQLTGDGEAAYTNSRLAELLGRDVTTSADLLASVQDGTHLAAALSAALTQGSDADLETVLQGRSDPHAAPRRLHLTIRALVQDDGTTSGAVVCVNDVTDAVLLREMLAHKATHDALTGCLSRGAIMDCLASRLDSPEPGVALLFIDLDRFKQLNDRFGHAAGDDLLRHVAEVLTANTRGGDAVGRLGGDEFLVMIGGVESVEVARAAVERMSLALSAPLRLAGEPYVPQASIGMAWTDRPTAATSLVAEADASMYRAKSTRSDRPTWSTEPAAHDAR